MLGVLLELLPTNKKKWFMKSYEKGNGKESNRIQLLSLHTFANTTNISSYAKVKIYSILS